MAIGRTTNPALNEKVFSSVSRASAGDVMTVDGTVNKAIVSVLLTMASAWWVWLNPSLYGLVGPFAIVGLIIAFIIVFKKEWVPILTPAYALAEGVVLGGISAMFEAQYPGIVFNAVSLTFGTLFALLLAYKSGVIKVTDKFRLGIVAATGGIFLLYLISFILSLFGVNIAFLNDASPLSITISIVVVIIAALNLVLDFEFIEKGANSGSLPKYMEWYGAFGLLVTLIWLYVEILRLLAKISSRRD